MTPAPTAAARVLVPRTGHHRFAEALRAAGAEVLEVTLTRTVPLDVEDADLDPAGAAWVLVTSARTVERLGHHEVGGRPWPAAVALARSRGTRVGSVGPATTAALQEVGVEVDAEAPEGTAARATVPSSRPTSTSIVGLPRESRISRAATSRMLATGAPSVVDAWKTGRDPR